jgi:hypothetical protein
MRGTMTHEFPIRPEHRAILARIQQGGENLDLIPGKIGEQEVVLVVEFQDDETGSPLMTYRVLAYIVTGDIIGVIKVDVPAMVA